MNWMYWLHRRGWETTSYDTESLYSSSWHIHPPFLQKDRFLLLNVNQSSLRRGEAWPGMLATHVLKSLWSVIWTSGLHCYPISLQTQLTYNFLDQNKELLMPAVCWHFISTLQLVLFAACLTLCSPVHVSPLFDCQIAGGTGTYLRHSVFGEGFGWGSSQC
jgi:hypothetical protein